MKKKICIVYIIDLYMGVIEDQVFVEENLNNRNIDLNHGRLKNDKIIRYLFNRHSE